MCMGSLGVCVVNNRHTTSCRPVAEYTASLAHDVEDNASHDYIRHNSVL